MKDPRSKEEIDTLLELFRKDERAVAESQRVLQIAAPKVPAGKVSQRDLFKPNIVAREHMRLLERLLNEIAEKSSLALGSRLRLTAHCASGGVDQLRYSTWSAASGGEPAVALVLKVEPFTWPVVMSLSACLLHGAVDRIMGGTGKADLKDMELSEAELAVAESVWRPLLDRLADGFARLVPVTIQVVERRSNTMLSGVLPAQEVVLSLTLKVSGDLTPGDVRIAIPYAALARHLPPVQKNLFLSVSNDPGEFREPIARVMRNVTVDLQALLGHTRLTVSELLGLKKGDVLLLDQRVDDPIRVAVQGKAKFMGRIGARGSRLAFKVDQVLTNEEH